MNPVRLLLVEDNDADAELVLDVFEAQKIRVEIQRAIDGVDALEQLRGTDETPAGPRPDLILLDLNLPRMDGRTFLAHIKQDPAFASIPVVVLTSSEAEQDIVQSYKLAAASYVAKPVDLKGLHRIVHAIDEFWLTVVRYSPPEGTG